MNPELLAKAIPTMSASSSSDSLIGACCLFCHTYIPRMDLKMLGKPFYPLPTCSCVMDREQKRLELEERMERKRRIQRTYARSLVADSIQDATLENFTYRDGTGIALTKSKEFVKHFSTRKTGILLFGKPGNGKSHLARGMEQAIDAMHYATLFLDWLKLCELAKATFSRNSKTTIADYVTAAVEADFLVLDELGAGTLSDFEFKNLLFPIVNGRQGKKTVYTTNLDIKRLASWMAAHDPDGRIIDRIIGSCEIVQNSGTSKRVEDAEKRMST